MTTLLLIPLDDTVVFPTMDVTLPVDVGAEDRVVLVPRHDGNFAKVGTTDYRRFQEGEAKGYDVVIFDWTTTGSSPPCRHGPAFSWRCATSPNGRNTRSVPRAGLEPATHGSSGHVSDDPRIRA